MLQLLMRVVVVYLQKFLEKCFDHNIPLREGIAYLQKL